MSKIKTIALSEETYQKLADIQNAFEKEHNAKKSYDQIIVDLVENSNKSEQNIWSTELSCNGIP